MRHCRPSSAQATVEGFGRWLSDRQPPGRHVKRHRDRPSVCLCAFADVVRVSSCSAAAKIRLHTTWSSRPSFSSIASSRIAASSGESSQKSRVSTGLALCILRLNAMRKTRPGVTPATLQAFCVGDVCSRCRVCEDACLLFAIGPEKQMLRGVDKSFVNLDKCIPFSGETSGCAVCIAVCSWALPGMGLNLAEKMARKRDVGGVTVPWQTECLAVV